MSAYHPPSPRTSGHAYSKPPLKRQTTTLWEYPSQHYGTGMQGDQAYVGATPSYIIWELLQRYTRPGELLVDPMCGSGTSIDVAHDVQRRVHGFDIYPRRADITCADARHLPLPNAACDLVFIDPPYGDHIHYSDAAGCMGRLSAFSDAYLQALRAVLQEAHRILKPQRTIAVYICDFFAKKKGFAPLGAQTLQLLQQNFRLVDHICVVRHNKSLAKKNYHAAAATENFFLRGFNHLIIAQKAAS